MKRNIILIAALLHTFLLSAEQLPDIEIGLPTLITGNKVTIVDYLIKQCEAADQGGGIGQCAPVGSIPQPGTQVTPTLYKKVIFFGTKAENITNIDFFAGNPQSPCHPDFFEFDACHHHYHTKGILEFKLFRFDNCGDITPTSFLSKHGACLCNDNNGCVSGHTCGQCSTNQGLSAYCTDEYGYDIDNNNYNQAQDCQFLYVDGIQDGRYILRITMNARRVNNDPIFNTLACSGFLEESNYSNNRAYYIFDMGSNSVPAQPPPSVTVVPPIPPEPTSTSNNSYINAIYPHIRQYISHTIPETLGIANVINQLYLNTAYPSNLNIMAIARKVIETGYNVGGGVILNDNVDREIVAGESIHLGPGTTISSAGGGRTHIYINSCLSTNSANYKTSAGDGLFGGEEIASVATLPRNDAATGLAKGEFSFEVKPNPFTKGFRITYTISDVIASQARNDVGFRMVNVMGQEVRSFAGTQDDKGVIEVSGEGLPAGVYSLEMLPHPNLPLVNGKEFRKRVVKVGE